MYKLEPLTICHCLTSTCCITSITTWPITTLCRTREEADRVRHTHTHFPSKHILTRSVETKTDADWICRVIARFQFSLNEMFRIASLFIQHLGEWVSQYANRWQSTPQNTTTEITCTPTLRGLPTGDFQLAFLWVKVSYFFLSLWLTMQTKHDFIFNGFFSFHQNKQLNQMSNIVHHLDLDLVFLSSTWTWRTVPD